MADVPTRSPDRATPSDAIRLALAILQHRPWCPDCAGHVTHVIAALRGSSIEEIAEGGC